MKKQCSANIGNEMDMYVFLLGTGGGCDPKRQHNVFAYGRSGEFAGNATVGRLLHLKLYFFLFHMWRDNFKRKINPKQY